MCLIALWPLGAAVTSPRLRHRCGRRVVILRSIAMSRHKAQVRTGITLDITATRHKQKVKRWMRVNIYRGAQESSRARTNAIITASFLGTAPPQTCPLTPRARTGTRGAGCRLLGLLQNEWGLPGPEMPQ